MTSNVFNIAATPLQPYTFNFDREVAAFYRDHPAQKKILLFIDVSTLPGGAICRGDEGDEDEIIDLVKSNGHLYAATASAHKTGKAGSVRFEEGYSCVLLKTPRNQNNISLLGYDAPSDIADIFSFDHEIGHLICPGGYEGGSPLMKECIADAYAVIRHLQRFGADADSVSNLAAMRTVEMILGRDAGHFTAPVVEKIIADAQRTNFSALTPTETTERAQRYAAYSAMDAPLVNYMAEHFNALRFNPAGILQGDFRALRGLGALVLKTNMPEEFKWGAVAVRAMLDGNIGVDGTRLPEPQGPEWTRLRQDIDARAARFQQQPQRQKLIVAAPL